MNAPDRERVFIARCALVLFIAGLLVPIIIGGLLFAFGKTYLSPWTVVIDLCLCIGFGFIAEVLALTLGIIGRRRHSGKAEMCDAVDIGDREHWFIARCSLVLFIAGLLVPLIIGVLLVSLGASDVIYFYTCLGLGFIAEVLALVFGIVGRRRLPGKVGMYGAIVVCALTLFYLGALAWNSVDFGLACVER
jgi:hypothetical protein